jgi:hypothetical protein
MKTTNPVDVARVELLLAELRLPAVIFGHNLKDAEHVFARPGTLYAAGRRFVSAARNVPPGQSRAFTDHRSMTEIIADEMAQSA